MDPGWRPDWGFAVVTLLIRFFGIFIVLTILQIAMQISGNIFKRWSKTSEEEEVTPSAEAEAVDFLSPQEPMTQDVKADKDEEQKLAAIIGAAISLYEGEEEASVSPPLPKPASSQLSDWTAMGRFAQLQSRVFQGGHPARFRHAK